MTIEALITLGVAIASVGIVNATVVAFSYGKISAKIDSLINIPERVENLETRVSVVETKCELQHGVTYIRSKQPL
jgi:hypothetical protein